MDNEMKEFILGLVVKIIVTIVVALCFLLKLRKEQTLKTIDKSVKPYVFKESISKKSLPKTDFDVVKIPSPLPSAKKSAKADTTPKIPAPEPAKPIRQDHTFTLKQAVIWSEILAPPVSLRD